MQIYYCDQCGLRIRSGEGVVGSDNRRLCDACKPKRQGSAVGIRPATPLPGSIKVAAFQTPSDTAARRRAIRANDDAVRKSNTTLLAGVGVGFAAVCAIGFFAIGRSGADRAEAVSVVPPEVRAISAEAAQKKAEPAASTPHQPQLTAAAKDATPVPAARKQLEKTAPAADAAVTATSAAPTAPVAPTLPPSQAAQAPQGKVEWTPENYREQYAKRRLDELMAQSEKSAMASVDLRARLSELARDYSNTTAGRDAAEKLKTIPEEKPRAIADEIAQAISTGSDTKAADALFANAGSGVGEISASEQAALLQLGGVKDAAPESSSLVLWQLGFDADADVSAVLKGTWEKQATGATGGAVKAEAVQQAPFTARIDLKMSGEMAPLKTSKDSWIKFTYKLQGSADLCVHVVAGGKTYEKFIFGPSPGKWRTSAFKLSDFTRCVTTGKEEQPAPNAEISSASILVASSGTRAGLLLDEILVGSGSIPSE